ALEGDIGERTQSMTLRTLDFLDYKMVEDYKKLLNSLKKEKDRQAYQPSSIIVHYLYIRSAYLQERELSGEAKAAWDYFRGRARAHWVKYGLYEQALLASAFSRVDQPAGKEIIESLRERAIRKDEFGMYWKYPSGWSWQQLPIETHCRIQEAFLRNGGTQAEMDDMRLYLLANKRTNRWETTKATAAAVYALLQTGTDWTSDVQSVDVSFPRLKSALYQTELASAQSGAEAGTGYYRVQYTKDKVTPDFAQVKLKNKEKTIAWGGMYWQFTQDIDAVEASENGPLSLQRRLFRRINTEEGERLEEISADKPMQPGERLVVQLVVKTDRDMDYVHLKDRRAAGLEPTEQLSGYRYESGLGFYFSPDDLAVHFFFARLPRGTYTLEYDTFVNHAGDFSNGLSVLQSMYAPEFSAYSKGSRLIVE
ncbi:MAG: alpha-2-macroglobulin, partial [Bacteroidota bacterium]